MRILLVESDAAVAQSIELMLRSERFKVYTTDEGHEGVDLGKLYDYDLILMDATPQLTICDMLKSLRLARCETPVLVLSADWHPDRIVQALGVGADDYMAKPFYKDELVARIHAIVRRSKGHAASVVTVGPLQVHLDTRTASLSGVPLPLTQKEYAMLELMALRKGSLVTKDMFLNHLYGGMDEPEQKIIDVFVCKLRKKLGEHADLVQTVWGRGYVLRSGTEVASLAPEIRDGIGYESEAGSVSEFFGNRCEGAL